ncbi:MAG: hypothetical protein OHK0044_22920 [Burkholderiaceae bacterium]
MTRLELVKQLAEFATRPLAEQMHQPVHAAQASAARPTELFVWFEDTSARTRNGSRGIAGLPESLLPYAKGMRVVERRYVEGHLHLLSAVRIRCDDKFGERVAALYTAALSVGTVAWIGTGPQYAQAWAEMYPYGGQSQDAATPDLPGEI